MIVGIDPSLTGTGVVILDDGGYMVTQKLIATSLKDCIEKRFDSIISDIKNLFFDNGTDYKIYIEGISFNSKGNNLAQICGLHYFIRWNLWLHKYQVKVVPPKTLKKHITGTGNGKKNLMLLKVYKKWGIEFDDDNLADAYGLARMGYDEHYKRRKT